MTSIENISTDNQIQCVVMRKVLSRIYSDPHFAMSSILKRFLSFVVEETLAGRSDQLNESTIALKVLDKPGSFQPLDDAMVKIYAGRVRNALHHYYNHGGVNETIRIDIPHETFIPIFKDAAQLWIDESESVNANARNASSRRKKQVTFNDFA